LPPIRLRTLGTAGVALPDKVGTRLGTLDFFDGFADKTSAEKPFDNFNFWRTV
jgi:hypothetical protein